MARKQAKNQTIETLLSQVVEEMNASVIDDAQLERTHAAAHALSKSRNKQDQYAARLMLDGATEMDSIDGQLREHYVQERRHIGDLFRVLAESGKLPKAAVDELLDLCRGGGVRANTQASWRDGRPVIEFVPVFDSPLSKAAYVLLQLANAHDIGHRIVACKQCGKLSLFELGHKGQPRKFCAGTSCGPNYHVAEKRRRDAQIIEARKAARAAKCRISQLGTA